MAVKRRGTGATAAKGGSEVLTLRELFERAQRGPWRDVKSYASLASNIKLTNEHLGDHAVEAVNAEVLENFAQRMLDQGYKPATVKRRLATIGRALSYAEKMGWIKLRPAMPEVKARNQKDRVLSQAEEEEVYRAIRLRHMREPWRRWDEFEDIVTVLLQTGGRLGEVLGIKSGDITTRGDNRYLTFQRYETKNDKPRTIPLTAQAQVAIERNIGEPCAMGSCIPGGAPAWHFNQTKAWFFFSLIRKDVGGIDDVTLHTLRHTALTRLAQGGLPLLQLSKWAGHSDPRITASRYTHLQPEDLDIGADILSR